MIHFTKKLPENVFSPATFITYCSKHIWNTELSEDELIDNFLECNN